MNLLQSLRRLKMKNSGSYIILPGVILLYTLQMEIGGGICKCALGWQRRYELNATLLLEGRIPRTGSKRTDLSYIY